MSTKKRVGSEVKEAMLLSRCIKDQPAELSSPLPSSADFSTMTLMKMWSSRMLLNNIVKKDDVEEP